jgi:hypothetical protein
VVAVLHLLQLGAKALITGGALDTPGSASEFEVFDGFA